MNPHPKLKASVVVLDQGNTLLMDPFQQVMELQKERFQKILRHHGIKPNNDNLCFSSTDNSKLETGNFSLILVWTQANHQVDYPFIGHFVQEEPIIQHALRQLGIKEDIAAILALDLLREYREGLKKVIVSDRRTLEVRATLQQLRAKGKKLGIFSNDRTIGLGLVLKAMDIRPMFEYIETSESIGAEKPDPRVFEHILSFFKMEPQEIVYIGDDPVRDINAAKDQGLKAVQILVDAELFKEPWRNYAAPPRHAPDAMIETFSEILDILD